MATTNSIINAHNAGYCAGLAYRDGDSHPRSHVVRLGLATASQRVAYVNAYWLGKDAR